MLVDLLDHQTDLRSRIRRIDVDSESLSWQFPHGLDHLQLDVLLDVLERATSLQQLHLRLDEGADAWLWDALRSRPGFKFAVQTLTVEHDHGPRGDGDGDETEDWTTVNPSAALGLIAAAAQSVEHIGMNQVNYGSGERGGDGWSNELDCGDLEARILPPLTALRSVSIAKGEADLLAMILASSRQELTLAIDSSAMLGKAADQLDEEARARVTSIRCSTTSDDRFGMASSIARFEGVRRVTQWLSTEHPDEVITALASLPATLQQLCLVVEWRREAADLISVAYVMPPVLPGLSHLTVVVIEHCDATALRQTGDQLRLAWASRNVEATVSALLKWSVSLIRPSDAHRPISPERFRLSVLAVPSLNILYIVRLSTIQL